MLTSEGALRRPFHIIFTDGAFYRDEKDKIVFEHSKKPTTEEVDEVNRTIKKRVVRYLKKEGIIQEYEEGNLQFEYFAKKDGLDLVYQNSIQRKIGIGKRRGHRIERVGATMATSWRTVTGERCSYLDGFSLHANVDVASHAREKLENLIKYTARPALANSRISKDLDGHILYELKNKYTDGTTHLRFTQTEFIEKIMALIPPPRKNLIRFFGVFGSHHRYREEVTDMIRKRPELVKEVGANEAKSADIAKIENFLQRVPTKPTYWIPWAELLKKTFHIDVLKCEKCGGRMKVANYVLDSKEIKRILLSLGEEIVDKIKVRSIDFPSSGYTYVLDDEYREQGPPLF